MLYWGSGYSNFGGGTPNNKVYAFGLSLHPIKHPREVLHLGHTDLTPVWKSGLARESKVSLCGSDGCIASTIRCPL